MTFVFSLKGILGLSIAFATSGPKNSSSEISLASNSSIVCKAASLV